MKHGFRFRAGDAADLREPNPSKNNPLHTSQSWSKVDSMYAFAWSGEECQCLDLTGLRHHVDGLDGTDREALPAQDVEVAAQGRRIAGQVSQLGHRTLRDGVQNRFSRTGARWI